MGQEESLCHMYPALLAHPGFASPHVVSNLFSSSCLLGASSSVRVFSFTSLGACLLSSSCSVLVSFPRELSGDSKKKARAPTQETKRVPKGVGLVCFFHLVSKGKPTEKLTPYEQPFAVLSPLVCRGVRSLDENSAIAKSIADVFLCPYRPAVSSQSQMQLRTLDVRHFVF